MLFADLVGSTGLAEQRDPEEVRELLSRYYERCRTVVARYGGTVEKFIGDAVMAVWGAPITREDDAERAVRAALELMPGVPALGAELGVPDLRARGAVITGQAAITLGAEGQGMVAGDLVTTASRVQSIAAPGEIWVDEATRKATSRAIASEDVGVHTLKGKAEGIPLWRALRVLALIGGAARGTSLEAPFVGRDSQLRLIKELFHAAAEKREARLVSITGIGGIGKSRLSWEFEKYIDGLAETVVWHRGRCLEYGDGVAYSALAEMVRMRAKIAEGEEPASAREKLRRTVADYVPDDEERRWLEPRLVQLVGLEGGDVPERGDVFPAWRLFFERVAARGPTVLVFEDLQSATAGLIDFIEYLLEWSRRHPLFIVTLARPEVAEKRPGWGSGKRNFTSLYLDPLEPAVMDELLDGMVPGLPNDVRHRIRDQAEGIPLYAVETVRMLLDRGVVRRSGDRYEAVRSIGELEVPETLHALIAARLDALPAAERSLLGDASVLGHTFTRAALVELTGLDAASLDGLLARLVRKELLTVETDPMSPERGQYGFLQALVRNVAYATLSKRERKARHLHVARYLEHNFPNEGEEMVEVIASHHLEAYRLEARESDASAIRDSARRALVRAGQRAASLAAPVDAERYFTQAADLADDPLGRAELLERAGQMAWRSGGSATATSRFEAAIELFSAHGRAHAAARVSARLGDVILTAGDRLQEAVTLLEDALGVLSEEDADEDRATVAAQLARFHHHAQNAARGLELIEVALEIAEAQALPELLSEALNTKGTLLHMQGRPQEGIALMRQALTVAEEGEVSSAALRAHANLGYLLGQADRYAAGAEHDAAGLALARKLGDRVWEKWILGNSLYGLYVTGRWDEAMKRVEEIHASEQYEVAAIMEQGVLHLHRGSLDDLREILADVAARPAPERPGIRADCACGEACLLHGEGRFAEAAARSNEALHIAAEDGNRTFLQEGFILAVEAAFALGDLGDVDDLIERVERMPRSALSRYHRAHVERFRARLGASRDEDPPSVEARYEAAAADFAEVGVPFGLAVTRLEHGEWLVRRGMGERSAALLQEACEIFERLGAAPWLERLAGVEDRAQAALSAPATEPDLVA